MASFLLFFELENMLLYEKADSFLLPFFSSYKMEKLNKNEEMFDEIVFGQS